MITTWIVIKDNKIIKSFETNTEEDVIKSLSFLNINDYDEIRDTQTNNSFKKNTDINEYDDNYNLKSDIERIIGGWMDAPKGKKLNEDKTELIDKTIKEKIDSEEIILSDSQIYDEDEEQIRSKTYIELYKGNLLSFDKIQEFKTNDIVLAFELDFQNGHFLSNSLGIEVDCRRSPVKNDKQNVEGLISNMKRKNKSTINYVGYTDICPNVTIEQLEELVAEMEDYVLGLYEKKWMLQNQITASSTIEEIENINW